MLHLETHRGYSCPMQERLMSPSRPAKVPFSLTGAWHVERELGGGNVKQPRHLCSNRQNEQEEPRGKEH